VQQGPRHSEIEAAMMTLLTSDVGYGICLFVDTLLVWPVADGSFAVSEANFDGEELSERVFAPAAEAIEHFEERRRQRQLGWDFERVASKDDEQDETAS
jgi:hypothetical protein